MDMASHSLLSSFADPPPFPPSRPELLRLERSVICQICKDNFEGPVTVECGHSFCSKCIRGSLDVMKEKKCPACDEPITERSIRRNRALEEITDAFAAARPTLITLCTTATVPKKRPAPGPSSKPSSSNSVKRPREGSSGSRSPSKRRSPRADDVVEVFGSEDDPPSDGEQLSENDIGECPMCQANLPISAIPMHIERGCPPAKKVVKVNGSGDQKTDWKRVFAGAGMGREKK